MITGEEAWLQRYRLNLRGATHFRNSDGSLQSLKIGPEWEMITKSDHSFFLGIYRRTENLRDPFELSKNVQVPTNRYHFYTGEASYTMPYAWNLRSTVGVSGGQFYDGQRRSFYVSPTWNASRFVRMDGFYQYNRIIFPETNQDLTTHIGRLRVEVTPNVKYSISSFIQYNSASEIVIGNVRFRYNPREGNDFYIVYNERLNTDRAAPIGNPRLPLTNSRTILLKYTYTFNR